MTYRNVPSRGRWPRAAARARHGVRRGLGLPELLIALAISAALLTATAVAIDASFQAYGVTQAQASLAQRARVSLHRIVTYIRTTEQHRPDNDDPIDDFAAGLVCTDTAIRMMTTDTAGVIFRQQDDCLVSVPFSVASGALVEGTAHVLIKGVQAGDFTVTFEPMKSAEQIRTGQPAYDQLKRASISLTVRPATTTKVAGEQVSAQPVTISAAVMPRRNFW